MGTGLDAAVANAQQAVAAAAATTKEGSEKVSTEKNVKMHTKVLRRLRSKSTTPASTSRRTEPPTKRQGPTGVASKYRFLPSNHDNNIQKKQQQQQAVQWDRLCQLYESPQHRKRFTSIVDFLRSPVSGDAVSEQDVLLFSRMLHRFRRNNTTGSMYRNDTPNSTSTATTVLRPSTLSTRRHTICHKKSQFLSWKSRLRRGQLKLHNTMRLQRIHKQRDGPASLDSRQPERDRLRLVSVPPMPTVPKSLRLWKHQAERCIHRFQHGMTKAWQTTCRSVLVPTPAVMNSEQAGQEQKWTVGTTTTTTATASEQQTTVKQGTIRCDAEAEEAVKKIKQYCQERCAKDPDRNNVMEQCDALLKEFRE